MLEMYTQEDLLILCVRLAVLLAVTLTVPVVLFPVSGGKEGCEVGTAIYGNISDTGYKRVTHKLVNSKAIVFPAFAESSRLYNKSLE